MAKRQPATERIRIQLSIDASNPSFSLLARLDENAQRRSLALSLLNTSAVLLLSSPAAAAGAAIVFAPAPTASPHKTSETAQSTLPGLVSAEAGVKAQAARPQRQRLRDFVDLQQLAG